MSAERPPIALEQVRAFAAAGEFGDPSDVDDHLASAIVHADNALAEIDRLRTANEALSDSRDEHVRKVRELQEGYNRLDRAVTEERARAERLVATHERELELCRVNVEQAEAERDAERARAEAALKREDRWRDELDAIATSMHQFEAGAYATTIERIKAMRSRLIGRAEEAEARAALAERERDVAQQCATELTQHLNASDVRIAGAEARAAELGRCVSLHKDFIQRMFAIVGIDPDGEEEALQRLRTLVAEEERAAGLQARLDAFRAHATDVTFCLQQLHWVAEGERHFYDEDRYRRASRAVLELVTAEDDAPAPGAPAAPPQEWRSDMPPTDPTTPEDALAAMRAGGAPAAAPPARELCGDPDCDCHIRGIACIHHEAFVARVAAARAPAAPALLSAEEAGRLVFEKMRHTFDRALDTPYDESGDYWVHNCNKAGDAVSRATVKRVVEVLRAALTEAREKRDASSPNAPAYDYWSGHVDALLRASVTLTTGTDGAALTAGVPEAIDSPRRVALWDAINAYAEAWHHQAVNGAPLGGHRGGARMDAVVGIERALLAFAPEPSGVSTAAGGGDPSAPTGKEAGS